LKTDKKTIVKRQLAGLDSLSMNELKNKFTELFGFECGETNARYLRKRLAYRLQEISLGGLDDEDAAILDSIANEDKLAKLEQPPARVLAKTPGTRFCRVWKGVEHEAVVLGNGMFEYNDKIYRSLSAVANAITGRHWNGKLFFGVK